MTGYFLDQGEYEEAKYAPPVIGVYVPTLGRKRALKRVAANINAATTLPHRIIFVCESFDQESIDEARKWSDRTLVNHDEPSYSNSLQVAYEADNSPFFIGANDDFDFQPGWDTAALDAMIDGVSVVGVNDGAPNCQFSTISLVRRSYIEEQSGVIDMPGRVNYPYQHNYVDTEFYCTAVHRGVFRACPESRVHHMHPDWGHAQQDDTYEKGQSSIGEDAATFDSRRHLWTT